MRKTTYFYLAAWLAYITFAAFLFPHLKITVMLYSIPLTMLGGWLYKYKGALATSILTIPTHYFLLKAHSDDPSVIIEAINPFGITTQLIFSCFTALLKASRDRYHELNNSLGELVEERTKDLEKLTHYLIDARQVGNQELNMSLLEQPYNELKAMLATSQLLKDKLEADQHPRASDAQNIHDIISSCVEQLRSVEDESLSGLTAPEDISASVQNLIIQMEPISEANITFNNSPAWSLIPPEWSRHLCDIIFEAVSNAVRHASPTEIKIGAKELGEGLVVFIENDGIAYSKGVREGMGLPLMRYRASKMAATLSIGPTQRNTTLVECRINIPG